jgi:hypothetical protein
MRPPLQSNEIPQQYLSSSYNKCEYE